MPEGRKITERWVEKSVELRERGGGGLRKKKKKRHRETGKEREGAESAGGIIKEL